MKYREHFGDGNIDDRIALNRVLKKQYVRLWTGYDPVASSREHVSVTVFTTAAEFLDKFYNSQLLKIYSWKCLAQIMSCD